MAGRRPRGFSMPLTVNVVRARELTAAQVRNWRSMQVSNPELSGPFFSPEFTFSVGDARSDVFVAVAESNGAVSFFPFQRRGRAGRRVGGFISDFHGAICRTGQKVDLAKILRASQIDAFDFDHMLPSQVSSSKYSRAIAASPQIDLSAGYEAFVARRRAAGSQLEKKSDGLRRKMEREVGPITFVADAKDSSALRTIMALKSDQYRRTGKPDLFGMKWVRETVEHIHSLDSDEFAGGLSLLYAGEHLVAGHFGMRTSRVQHYWFPAFDRRFSKYSPGLLLLLELLKNADERGVEIFDLGKEMSLYKQRLMNACVTVAEGYIELPSMVSIRRKMWRSVRSAARAAVNGTEWSEPARRAFHRVRQIPTLLKGYED
jgi:CelD/BcsL family acetyltransferase involved in cellulose biosynthesis